MDRRTFLESILAFNFLPALTPALENRPDSAEEEEDFWRSIRGEFMLHPSIINLNNGGVSPHPRSVVEALFRMELTANEAPAYVMWRIQDQKEPIRQRLAAIGGADPEEIAIVRNSTEALETVIFGLNLKAGDEVIAAESDYPSMIAAWKQREARDGIKVRWLRLPLPSEDEDKLVAPYLEAITPRTRVIHLTHLINWTGQIVPVEKVTAEARKRGIFTIVDAAHSYAHIPLDFHAMGCDAAGVSLHKWLCAPFGTGLLYVKKERIRDIWPLFAPAADRRADDIRKFEHLGTRSIPTEQAIAAAIDFHERIGSQRKFERLKKLRQYWLSKAIQLPKIKSLTPDKLAGALATIQVDGWSPQKLADHLLEKHRIFVVGIDWAGMQGIRVTPHVYTTFEELDKLVDALRAV
ncbi:MAG: aminotransferase class V-fold PLP-dependent enzyme [Bacteroidia bacterium]|nr:aminotransferase class V-fold PLP-dependent enzyme [Bacteroidia bacterium]MCX7652273.1 aminotransferase class V-fold PLP-dependent enzyme [Bacteroidia bacterium]MDW8416535.1 aminotransferase class V-fold PLP-dependent enzyme [Bacteroidia bacterium]